MPKTTPKKVLKKSSSKKVVKKTTPKKRVVKKTTPKRSVKKTTPKKRVVKKTTPKRAVKKTTPKKVIKKTTPKRVVKKTTPKRSVKKTTPKKKKSLKKMKGGIDITNYGEFLKGYQKKLNIKKDKKVFLTSYTEPIEKSFQDFIKLIIKDSNNQTFRPISELSGRDVGLPGKPYDFRQGMFPSLNKEFLETLNDYSEEFIKDFFEDIIQSFYYQALYTKRQLKTGGRGYMYDSPITKNTLQSLINLLNYMYDLMDPNKKSLSFKSMSPTQYEIKKTDEFRYYKNYKNIFSTKNRINDVLNYLIELDS